MKLSEREIQEVAYHQAGHAVWTVRIPESEVERILTKGTVDAVDEATTVATELAT
jgi:ATP-dependent Zn protease